MFIEFNNVFKKHKTATMVILGAFISIPFVFYTGSGSSIFDSMSERIIGEVNQRDIKASDYANSYFELAVGDYLQNKGFRNDPRDEEAKRNALSRIAILEALVTDEALLAITDKEVVDYIKNNAALKREGINPSKVIEIFRNRFGVNGIQFDNIVRQNIVLKKHEDKLKASIQVSDEEAKTRYSNENLTFDVLYKSYAGNSYSDAILKKEFASNKEAYKDLDFTKARPQILENLFANKAQEHYEANLKKYEIPTRVTSVVIMANPADYETAVTVSDEDIKAYYTENTAEFTGLNQVKNTLISVPLLPKTDSAKLKKELDAALALLKAGDKETLKKFTAVKSTTDWINVADLDKDVVAASNSEKEEFIIQASQLVFVKKAATRTEIPFEEAKNGIATSLKQSKGREALNAELKKFSTEVVAFAGKENFSQNLDGIIKSTRLTTQELEKHEPRRVAGLLRPLGISLAMPREVNEYQQYFQQMNALNSISQAKPVTPFFESSDGRIFMLALDKESAPLQQTLEEVRATVLGEIHSNKALSNAREAADKAFEDLKNADAEALKKAKFTTSGLKEQHSLPQGLGSFVNSDSKKAQLYIQETQSGSLLFSVTDIKKPSEEDIEKNFAATKERITGERLQEKLAESYKAIIDKAAVTLTAEPKEETTEEAPKK